MTSVESAPRELKHKKNRSRAAQRRRGGAGGGIRDDSRQKGSEGKARDAIVLRSLLHFAFLTLSLHCCSLSFLPPSPSSCLPPFRTQLTAIEQKEKPQWKKKGAKIISMLTVWLVCPQPLPLSLPLSTLFLFLCLFPPPPSPPVTLKYHLQSLLRLLLGFSILSVSSLPSGGCFDTPTAAPLDWRLKSISTLFFFLSMGYPFPPCPLN